MERLLNFFEDPWLFEYVSVGRRTFNGFVGFIIIIDVWIAMVLFLIVDFLIVATWLCLRLALL